MKCVERPPSTGLPGLDNVLHGLRLGDNVVWEVDSIEAYEPLVLPFWREALRQKRKVVYFRFARHGALLPDCAEIETHVLKPEESFERFLTEILDVIERTGEGAFYVFDCLSDLAADWFSDRMLGNFFRITCPYLYKLQTIAYFALQKSTHSFHATNSIDRTAQVILEVFRKNDQLYIHPLKVWQRYSPTLYMLHIWDRETNDFLPVTSSSTITDILAEVPQPWLDFTIHRPGVWTNTFHQAQQTLNAMREGMPMEKVARPLFERLLKMVVTNDERFFPLAKKYLTLADVVEIMKRMIGSGMIGGKSFGMLLARAILKKTAPAIAERLEAHDSFYIGTDVFYTYIVENGCWWLRRRCPDFEQYLKQAAQAREKMLEGKFPGYIKDQFAEMLEYFGQSPIIVRSSSLLEDSYGNAFSGKYESVFCANQGSPSERLEALMSAVRTVFASTMSEEGLRYRMQHGLLDRDEQMALLVQRVSGDMHENLFFPDLAGVGFSFNPFVWHEQIDPTAGFLRLVFGLGTRAVERTGDDYSWLVALNMPLKRIESKAAEMRRYTQRQVDVLDLQANALLSRDFSGLAPRFPAAKLDLFARSEVLDFEELFRQTDFAAALRSILHTLQQAYNHPVDIEFTTNFQDEKHYRINLVQCRPFQVKFKGKGSRPRIPEKVGSDRIVFQSQGPIVGQSLATAINRLIYVAPSVYSQMSMSHRYSIARLIGKLTHLSPASGRTLALIGPGRWGTSMPALGVPVSFAEINTVSILCELTLMHEGLVPDVSLGTHFFNDLVEMDMLYLAVSPGKEGHVLNEALLSRQPNQLSALLPGAAEWAKCVWVVDADHLSGPGTIFLNVDSMKQRALCYWEMTTEG